jgi:hydrogenase maturation protease
MNVAVIGIGQSLRGDDAAGLEAVCLWQRTHTDTSRRSDVSVELISQPGPDLLEALRGADSAVLVDALRPGRQPGAVRQLEIEDLESASTNSPSLHGWGVMETLALGRAIEALPQGLQLRCLGIEAENIDVGESLTERVAQVLPIASDALEEIVQSLLAS